MKDNVKEIIAKRPITEKDLAGYSGFCYKGSDQCIFEQNKCIDNDIFGHDTYSLYCTRSGKLKETNSYVCENKCTYKTTKEEYEKELGKKEEYRE